MLFKVYFSIGLATINPVAASPHVGFGNPSPDSTLKLSILDYQGFYDNIIPYNRDSPYCLGVTEGGGLIGDGGYYYEEKQVLIDEWSAFMNCQNEEPYSTPYDGENGFQCFERKCSNGRSFVRCEGYQAHEFPLIGQGAAEVAWNFMKNHPKQF